MKAGKNAGKVGGGGRGDVIVH